MSDESRLVSGCWTPWGYMGQGLPLNLFFGREGGDAEAVGGSLSQEIMKGVYFLFNLFSTRRGFWGKGDSPFPSAAAQCRVFPGDGHSLEKTRCISAAKPPLCSLSPPSGPETPAGRGAANGRDQPGRKAKAAPSFSPPKPWLPTAPPKVSATKPPAPSACAYSRTPSPSTAVTTSAGRASPAAGRKPRRFFPALSARRQPRKET